MSEPTCASPTATGYNRLARPRRAIGIETPVALSELLSPVSTPVVWTDGWRPIQPPASVTELAFYR